MATAGVSETCVRFGGLYVPLVFVSFSAGGPEPPLLESKANTKTFCMYSNCTPLRVVRRGEIFQ